MASDLVLADDATGALECASLLAGLGLDTVLSLEPSPPDQPYSQAYVVVDTASRHLAPAQAARHVRAWLTHPHERVFKKTDSTLRGNIAAELMALSAGCLAYLPAYPAVGRTVRDGRLYVDGIPVAETAFGSDARQPVRSSAAADLFPAGTPVSFAADDRALKGLLTSGRQGILICDAETDEDMASLALVLRENAPLVPVASPAGFMPNWAGAAERQPALALPHVADWLVVCGSLHPQSRLQAARAAADGVPVAATDAHTRRNPDAVAEELAERCATAIQRQRPAGVLVMGGDTARALWRQLGIRQLTPLPEVLPGVAACQGAGFVFVTKAGGFGEESLVEQVRKRFT